MFWMPGKSYRGPLLPLGDGQKRLAEALRGHVETLAVEIGERNMFRSGSLDRAARYIQNTFESIGYEVQLHHYELDGQTMTNLVAELPGTSGPEQIVIVGAHYDSVVGSPGANDNASGVAGLLALARALLGQHQPRSIRFVAFVNEEPPFFQTEQMGSYVYAQRCRAAGERIVAMMAMDGIGCYSDAKTSQQYPMPVGWLYPSRGNFIGFISRVSDGPLLRLAIRSFRRQARFPSEGAALPWFVAGVSWSDHWSFWQFDYDGLMVTDTLPFRDRHYHLPSDTAHRLDYQRMAWVVEGLGAVVTALAADR